MNKEEFAYIKNKIRELTKFDLDNYGYNQMIRRLDGFISRAKVSNVAQYGKLLEDDAVEREKLEKFLTINVSEFFRDVTHFKILQDRILPHMLQHNLRINVWSAGCSNGAEAYSVAIILDSLSPYRHHRILATDIDTNILEQAMAGGPYKAADIRNVPETWIAKYFTPIGPDFQVIDRIRNKVIFKQHDLTRDHFERNFDLIICRNVVIYFSGEMKKKIRRKFLDALKTNGVLFIGATETMLDASDSGFQRMSPCFYRKTGDVPEKSRVMALSHK